MSFYDLRFFSMNFPELTNVRCLCIDRSSNVHCWFKFLSVFGDEPLEKLPNRCLEAHSSLIGRCAKTPKDLEDRILICISHDLQKLPTTKIYQACSLQAITIRFLESKLRPRLFGCLLETKPRSHARHAKTLDCRGRSYETNWLVVDLPP